MRESTLTLQSGGAIIVVEGSALTTNYAGAPKRFATIAPMRWREVNGRSRLALINDPAGDGGAWMVVTNVPIFVLQQVPPLQRRTFNTVVLASTLAVFAITLVVGPVDALL